MKYLTSSFSPSMLKKSIISDVQTRFTGYEIDFDEFIKYAKDAKSCIGHEKTAAMLTEIAGISIKFNRVNIELEKNDEIVVAIPQFRTDRSREFTEDEMINAGFRYFHVKVQ